MAWILLLLALLLLITRLVRRRREVVPIFPGESVSTLHTEHSRKTSKETKAALDAATRLLR